MAYSRQRCVFFQRLLMLTFQHAYALTSTAAVTAGVRRMQTQFHLFASDSEFSHALSIKNRSNIMNLPARSTTDADDINISNTLIIMLESARSSRETTESNSQPAPLYCGTIGQLYL
ncbi:hypothetical protein NQ318_007108 [Aromia moschata]|uniref:Secreted protein n=1 Tax=Aromia moschata TaxID=1265417 RepID=A0AAV8X7K4_9CUCU|nr:hypothetical protein NQ318_007108 [Aromia moschata]